MEYATSRGNPLLSNAHEPALLCSPSVEPDDLALLEAWRAGDAEAGEVLFERHFDAVFRFVRGKVGDPADDLVQQAFLACVAGRDRLREGASFRAYLFAAARNLVYEHWRQKYRGESVALPDDLGQISVHDLGPSPSSLLGARDDERLLVMALRRLPLDFQMAIELYYVQGLKTREVAEVLGIPHATVRSRLRRGLEQTREWVERLADTPAVLETTMTRLDAWARRVHERAETD
jgi:RNA polymerase sigma-70 factor (ECF subfamily)